MEKRRLAKAIEHTLLKPDTVSKAVRRLCSEAKDWNFHGVCINPVWVSLAKEELAGSSVRVVTVAGFPLGADPAKVKCFEVEEAIASGADEVDVVQNIGLLKEGSFARLKLELQALVAAAGNIPLKLIIETALLEADEKEVACRLACEAGFAFVKTSTGFLGGGASVEDVELMKKAVGDKTGVKASAGIRDAATAWALLKAGADRLGTSFGVTIMRS